MTKSAPRTGTATTANPAGLPLCLCGCELPTKRDRNYRPGHDARHAGVVGRSIAQYPDQAEVLLADLPTTALRIKAERVAANEARRAEAKANKAARKASRAASKAVVEVVPAFPIPGTLKVGRWTYEAQQEADGSVVYLTKKGEAKIATADQAAKFVRQA